MQVSLTDEQANFVYSATILRAAELGKQPNAQGVAKLRRELWRAAASLAFATGETEACDLCNIEAEIANRDVYYRAA